MPIEPFVVNVLKYGQHEPGRLADDFTAGAAEGEVPPILDCNPPLWPQNIEFSPEAEAEIKLDLEPEPEPELPAASAGAAAKPAKPHGRQSSCKAVAAVAKSAKPVAAKPPAAKSAKRKKLIAGLCGIALLLIAEIVDLRTIKPLDQAFPHHAACIGAKAQEICSY